MGNIFTKLIELIIYLISLFFRITPNPKPKSQSYEEIITSLGYHFEEHKIITKDGYILTIWRIHLKKSTPSQHHLHHNPIIVHHGLLDCSWSWFTPSKDNCLPYLLSNQGYDVWLPNSRGNLFSTEHINPNLSSENMFSAYWNFSLDEMAKYDLPAVISYIKRHTKHKQIDYVGHSQGSTLLLLTYILYPQYIIDSIRSFCALGIVPNMKYACPKGVDYVSQNDTFFKALRFGNFMNTGVKNTKFIVFAWKHFKSISSYIISFIVETKATKPTKRFKHEELNGVMRYEIGGSSYKNIMQWLQMYQKKGFHFFDYEDKERNMEKYGSEYAPRYNFDMFKEWTVKTFMTVSDSDPYSTEEDVKEFRELLVKCHVQMKKVARYNHLDYLWSNDARNDIYDDIIAFIRYI